MTNYQDLIDLSDERTQKALEWANKGYRITSAHCKMVSDVAKEEALNLTLQEACDECYTSRL